MTRRRSVVGGVLLTVMLTMTACGGPGAADGLEAVEHAVRDSSSAFDDVFVEDGLDGFSRYLFVELGMTGETLPPDELAAALSAVGETIPDGFDSVRLVARSSSGDRLDLERPMEDSDVDGVFMINSNLADIPAEALRNFAGER
ncbi:hypothetical protein [Agromyces sp. Root81]|uniref:hypothetical protein n=1 Tax=Agromyces sp. Root81 TaxID=1736601 RepID=UPI0012FA088E|nr:hypothetical protein [Agromyces sp. Root81]